jgi:Methionine synthase I, cobalamin-binding domain
MGAQIEEFATAGLVNIVGGCCGSTPEHIRAIVRAVAGKAPRPIPRIAPRLRLSGFEPFTLTPEIPFVNIGERTNVTGSARFRKLIKAGDFAGALAVARDQVENGPRSSTSTWTKACSTRRPHGDVSQPAGRLSPTSRACR